MRCRPCVLLLALALLPVLALLAGCGGGGGLLPPPDGAAGTGAITGSVALPVITGTRAALAGVTVSIEGTTAGTTVAADGAFTLTGVPAGEQTVVVQGSGIAAAAVAVVQPDRTTSMGEMVVRETGAIGGTVIRASNGAPVADALVVVLPSQTTDTTLLRPIRFARTHTDGTYTVNGLPVGDYRVGICKRGFEAQALQCTVAAGATTDAGAALTAVATVSVGSVRGTVRAADGRVLPGVLVRLAPQDFPPSEDPLPATTTGAGRELFAFTDVDGTYAIDGIPSARRYVPLAVRPGFLPSKLDSVWIAAGATTTVDFTLARRPVQLGIVSGTVTDTATGEPIAGARVVAVVKPGTGMYAMVNALASTPDCVLVTRTDAAGAYRLTVPVSVTAVLVMAEGYVPLELPVQVSDGAIITRDAALSTIPTTPVTLQGRVTMEVGGILAAAPNATVTARSISLSSVETTPLTAQADANGDYQLTLDPGQYVVYAQLGGIAGRPVRLGIYADTTQDLTLAAW